MIVADGRRLEPGAGAGVLGLGLPCLSASGCGVETFDAFRLVLTASSYDGGDVTRLQAPPTAS